MRNQSLAHLLMGALFLSLMACASGGSGSGDGSTDGGDGSTDGGDGSTDGGDGSTDGGDGSTDGGDGSTDGGDGSTDGGDGSTDGGDGSTDGGDGSTDGGDPNTYYALTDSSADALAATYTSLAGVELVVTKTAFNKLIFQEPSNSHVIRETSGTWSYSGTNPSPASLSDASMSDRSVYGAYTVTGGSYDYVQSYTQPAASGSDTAVLGIVGLVTDASEMASLNGVVTYTGTAEGVSYLVVAGNYLFTPTCCVGIATVTANFASNSVNVAIATDPDATGLTTGAVIVSVTGMAIEGNGFSGGTVPATSYTSNYTYAQGYFYGPASDGGPAEVGGIISGNGLDATGDGNGFFYTFMAGKPPAN